MNGTIMYTEIFLINSDALPPLYAYELKYTGPPQEKNSVAWKLCYALNYSKIVGGHWVWSNNHLITDHQNKNLQNFFEQFLKVEREKGKNAEAFGAIAGIKQDKYYTITAEDQAYFVGRGLIHDAKDAIQYALNKFSVRREEIMVIRDYDIRCYAINNYIPAVSFSPKSKLVSYNNIADIIYKKFPKLETIQRLSEQAIEQLKESFAGEEFDVKDFNTSFTGTIIDVYGLLKKCRKELLNKTTVERNRQLINEAPDNEIVFTVVSKRNPHQIYQYIASALYPIFNPGTIDKAYPGMYQQIRNDVSLSPEQRKEIIDSIRDAINSVETCKNVLGELVNSRQYPTLFYKRNYIDYPVPVLFGDGATAYIENGRDYWEQLTRHGMYKMPFSTQNPLHIGVVKMIEEKINRMDRRWFTLREEIVRLGRQCKVPLVFLEANNICKNGHDIIETVSMLNQKGADIILGILPESYYAKRADVDFYATLKRSTLEYCALPSQAVFADTLDKEIYYPARNIALALFVKAGCVPYIFAEPLSYADYFLGYDVGRKLKTHGKGTINVSATTCIYNATGEMLYASPYTSNIEGETLPREMLEELYIHSELKGKHIIVHRDGFYRGKEKEILREVLANMGSTCEFVEILKYGSPRLWQVNGNMFSRVPKGTFLKIGDTEAIVQSTLPPFEKGTPQPLVVKVDDPTCLLHAIHSVLALTLTNYASLSFPKLPETLQAAHNIAFLEMLNVRPSRELEYPYW